MRFLIAVLILILVIGSGWYIFGRGLTDKNNLERDLETDLMEEEQEMDTTHPAVTDLQVEDLEVGEGDEVKAGDTVHMHYTGFLLDGTIFDSSYDREQPFITVIGKGNVIQGWDEGIPGMRVGGKRKLTIPAEMAYGERGARDKIPPNAPLIFEVELLKLER